MGSKEKIVVSTFDGMSVGQFVLDVLGIKIDKYYASEIKEDAIKVTQENYPNTIQIGDVTKVKSSDFNSKVFLFIGGSPCQNLSIANKEIDGLEGEKSKLFYEYVRLKNELNPTYFLLENVASPKKEDIKIISDLLGVEPIQINSSKFSGQLRNRLYWTNIPVDLEELNKTDYNIKLQDLLDNGYTDRLKSRCLLESDSRPLSTPIKMFHRYYSSGFTTLIFKNEEHYQSCKKHYDTYFTHIEIDKNGKEKYKKFSAKEIDDKTKELNIDLSVYDGVRYLNQSELERLQNMPVGYCDVLNDRNKSAGLLGDGWNAETIKFIFKGLK